MEGDHQIDQEWLVFTFHQFDISLILLGRVSWARVPDEETYVSKACVSNSEIKFRIPKIAAENQTLTPSSNKQNLKMSILWTYWMKSCTLVVVSSHSLLI